MYILSKCVCILKGFFLHFIVKQIIWWGCTESSNTHQKAINKLFEYIKQDNLGGFLIMIMKI